MPIKENKCLSDVLDRFFTATKPRFNYYQGLSDFEVGVILGAREMGYIS